MSRFNTGNPIGSGSPLDLDDNAKNLDVLVNSTAETNPDRFGRSRLSYQGMEDKYNRIIDGMGLYPAEGSFEAGGTITERNQYLLLETAAPPLAAGGYSWGGALPKVVPPGSTPATTGGTPTDGTGWVYRGEATVRAALADGSAIINGQAASDLSDKRRVDRSRVMSIISAADAIRKQRPNIKPELWSDISKRLAQRKEFISSFQAGASEEGLVFGTYIGYNDSLAQPVLGFFAPANGEVGAFEVEVTIKTITGLKSAYAVSAALSNNVTEQTATTTLSATTLSGDTYSGSVTTTTGNEYVGIYIRCNTLLAGDKHVITDYKITSPSGHTYKGASNRSLSEPFISLSRRSDRLRSLVEYWPDGCVTRIHGNLSGAKPSCIWIGENATLAEDTDVSNVGFAFNAFGYSELRPMTTVTALQLIDTFGKNGFEYPAIMCLPGTYDSVNTSVAQFDLSSIYQDVRIYAPYGDAVFEKTVGGGSGAVVDTGSTLNPGLQPYWLYMWGINSDATQGRPFRIQHLNCKAFQCDLAYSLVDGWEFDNNNFILQECFATGATNDGFNHHGFGHGVLIDCIADANLDDGFSPHDLCTYEVWGGEYTNNGKGNVIPAFGAQGFCVDVHSEGATGLSDRANPTNYGGFVCIATDDRRDTTMFLVDCTDVGSVIGINSCGKNSNIRAIGFNGSGNSEYPAGNFAWSSEASPEVFYKPGNIEIYNSTFNNQTNFGINDPVKFAILSSATLDGDA